MKYRDYKFESKEEFESARDSVLNFIGIYTCPEDVNYSSLLSYKKSQLSKLLGDKYDITPEDLMMYLTCPVGVEDINNKTNFGIRTNSGSGNGNLNRSLSKAILFYSLDNENVTDEYLDKIFDFEIDSQVTLTNNDDLRDLYAPSMLEDTNLLYYLFLTGRGEDFTNIYGDVEFLKKLESGTFNEDEVLDRMPKNIRIKQVASKELKEFFIKDENKIIEIRKNELQKEIEKEPTYTYNKKLS